MEKIILSFEEALLSLDRLRIKELIEQATKNDTNIQVVEKLVVPALEKIGAGWQNGDIALSQVYMSGRICEELIDEILPAKSPDRKSQPKMAIAALDDYHLLGKRIVYSVLRSSGFELQDYGRQNSESMVKKAIEDEIRILLVSTLMLPSALAIKDLRNQFNEKQVSIKIVVGGAPFLFDSNLWKEVGADAMGKNASESVVLVSKIMGDLS
ncbi:cobalamin B12-binding domain-containing protein [Candidatus Magnetomorum sp. HK-1]|nr:cobalamin B12-binding domain-containing protein [Candidatus Magnetomorum sp. HK-1]